MDPVSLADPVPAPSRGALTQAAYAAMLASVPGVGPKLLRRLTEREQPEAVWAWLCDGRATHPGTSLPEIGHDAVLYARGLDVAAAWDGYVRAGVRVQVLGEPGYPSCLAKDAEAPAVLFSLGDVSVLDTFPRVAIVGTRSATRYGLGLAAQLGGELAAAGIVVVSGLALGIDGAAHEGAVAAWNSGRGAGSRGAVPTGAVPTSARPASAAPPVAVVAGSVTSPYPRQHAALWRRIAEAGAVLSEAPIGSAELAWRFPLRNRIVAALADVVVVVECHVRGGSFHTVRAATARSRPVGAVPGSVRSPASVGTNALLSEGCFVVRDVSDVLVALELVRASSQLRPRVPARPREQPPGHPGEAGRTAGTGLGWRGSEDEARVLAALGWELTSVDGVVDTTGLPLREVFTALEHLRGAGIAREEGGSWTRV